jgi:hypothetical protein
MTLGSLAHPMDLPIEAPMAPPMIIYENMTLGSSDGSTNGSSDDKI